MFIVTPYKTMLNYQILAFLYVFKREDSACFVIK